jgi:hypothetical protein
MKQPYATRSARRSSTSRVRKSDFCACRYWVTREMCGARAWREIRFSVCYARPMANWIRLRRGNDWGVDYFAINPLTPSGASRSQGINLREGEAVPVRLADGTETTGTVTLEQRVSSVSDHGHSSSARSELPHVNFSFHGQMLRARIDELEVDEAWARQHGAR